MDHSTGINVNMEDPSDSIVIAGRALWLFRPDNEMRQSAAQLISEPRFDSIILLCIFLSSIALACESPGASPNLLEVIRFLDVVFMVVFTLEMGVKLVALGLLCESKHTYRATMAPQPNRSLNRLNSWYRDVLASIFYNFGFYAKRTRVLACFSPKIED